MKKPSVVVIGNGVVGTNLLNHFPWAAKHDPAKGFFADEEIIYDYAFVCVQTPPLDDGSCDTSFVAKAFSEIQSYCYILKSTVPPGTTETLRRTTGKVIVFSPEYEGESQHANNIDYDFVILGGDRTDTAYAAQLFQHAYDARLRIYQTTHRTAELVKYMENAFLATKVVFCNEFFRIAKMIGVEYTQLRELFVLDPRAGHSHTFVYEDQPFYDSKCLNKDVPAIAAFVESLEGEATLLRAVIGRNEQFKAGE